MRHIPVVNTSLQLPCLCMGLAHTRKPPVLETTTKETERAVELKQNGPQKTNTVHACENVANSNEETHARQICVESNNQPLLFGPQRFPCARPLVVDGFGQWRRRGNKRRYGHNGGRWKKMEVLNKTEHHVVDLTMQTTGNYKTSNRQHHQNDHLFRGQNTERPQLLLELELKTVWYKFSSEMQIVVGTNAADRCVVVKMARGKLSVQLAYATCDFGGTLKHGPFA